MGPFEKSFGDIKVELSPITGMKGAVAFHRLGRCFSPSIAKIIGAIAEGKSGAEFNVSALQMDKVSDAMTTMFSDCTEEDLKFFIDTFVKPGIANGMPLDKTIDLAFQGKTLSLFKVLIWAVTEVHYADFFGDLPGLLGRAQALAASQKVNVSTLSPDSQTLKK